MLSKSLIKEKLRTMNDVLEVEEGQPLSDQRRIVDRQEHLLDVSEKEDEKQRAFRLCCGKKRGSVTLCRRIGGYEADSWTESGRFPLWLKWSGGTRKPLAH